MSLVTGLDILFPMLLLFFAVHISASTVLKTMIKRYKQQAFILAAFVIFTAMTTVKSVPIALMALLPFVMGLSIEPILARATLVAPQLGIRDFLKWSELIKEAELTWLEHGRLRLPPGYSFLLDATLTTLAFVVAYNLGGTAESEKVSFAVSLALLMLGLFMMINNQDLLAQVIGLLVSEHGLFLAAIRLVRQKELAVIFAISLFFYLALTLTILLWVLPSLREKSQSLEVKDQTQLRG